MPSSAYQDPTQDNAWDVRSISLPGRGIRTRAPFRLADCADDVAAVADELGIERFFAATGSRMPRAIRVRSSCEDEPARRENAEPKHHDIDRRLHARMCDPQHDK